MLSSDKNVETLTQLIEMLKHNIELRTEYAKLDATEKIVRLISVATLAVLLLMIFTAAMLFASLAYHTRSTMREQLLIGILAILVPVYDAAFVCTQALH